MSTQLRSTLLAVSLLICVPLCSAQTAQTDEQRPFVRHESAHLTASVASVDPKRRSIVLVTPSGERSEFAVGPEVKNFSQIKAGDHVVLSYFVGVITQLRPPGTAAHAPIATQRARSAPEGSKPSAAVTTTLTTTVKIRSVDTATNHVTFQRADGSVDRVAIEDPQAQQRMRKLKPGDAVSVTYAEQQAISVQPALR